MKKTLFVFVAIVGLLLCAPLHATLINSSSDSVLSGANVIDFEAQTNGRYSSLTIGDVTFSALNNDLSINNSFSGVYNATGRYLNNEDYSNNGFTSLKISFASGTNAFGFNWGASDDTWTLKAYDSSDNLLDTATLPAVLASNAGDFFGISSANISYATLVQDGSVFDWIFIDNFKYNGENSQAVPEPATMLLLGTGLIGLAFGRKKFKSI